MARVRLDDAGRHALRMNRWGLIPAWSKDAKIGYSLTNAAGPRRWIRKRLFRAAFKSRRCLIPSSGFYEWAASGGKHKQPYHFRRIDGALFGFAGLWERWRNPEGQAIETCSIITTTANGVVEPMHDRMPVILAPADYAGWMDSQTTVDDLLVLLKPYPADMMTAVAVNSYVSNVRNQGPDCIRPIDGEQFGKLSRGHVHEHADDLQQKHLF